MSKIFKQVTDLIGGTPIMELSNIEKNLSLEATLVS